MRLLFLTEETYPTHRADVAVLFGKYLPAKGIVSDIVAGRSPEHDGPLAWNGGKMILCDVGASAGKRRIKTFLHGLRNLLTAPRSRYNAIQVRDMPVLGVLGLFAARIKRLPFYYWMSYPMPEGQIAYARERGLSMGIMKFLFPWVRGHIGKFFFYKFLLPNADHLFVQSERMKQDLLDRGGDATKMLAVPMGVDLETARPDEIIPIEDPRLEGRRVMVYLGTLDRPRKIEVLFEVLANVKEEFPNVLLVLVGDTSDEPHRNWLRERAVSAGVASDVVWTGWLPIRDGWRYVRRADIALSPIPRGFLLDCSSPTKVPEYLALRIPVLCNDNPDQQAIIEKSGAGSCVPYDAKSFATAAVRLLQLSPIERNAMGESGARHIECERSYQVIAAKLATRYMTLFSHQEMPPHL